MQINASFFSLFRLGNGINIKMMHRDHEAAGTKDLGMQQEEGKGFTDKYSVVQSACAAQLAGVLQVYNIHWSALSSPGL